MNMQNAFLRASISAAHVAGRRSNMHRPRYSLFVKALLCSLPWMPLALGQSSSGTVAGTAKDSGASALQGALVKLDPLGKQAVTDNHGQFRIADVAPGDYTVTVSYVGFAPF